MRIAVVGGNGFIGRSVVQALAGREGVEVVAFGIGDGTDVPVPYLECDLAATGADLSVLAGFDSLVFVAGGADHSLGDRDPMANLTANCLPLFRCLEAHSGRVVLLSSQAVYSGLTGMVGEDVDHIPSMPYGLAKAVAERHAMVMLARQRIASLAVFRLMYAFGPGESARRLIRRLATQRSDDAPIEIAGMGRSFLNPLPVRFVGEVLAASAGQSVDGPLEVVNLNHPEPTQVTDVVRIVHEVTGCRVSLTEGGEAWPVSSYGDSRRLQERLPLWDLSLPDVEDSVRSYVRSLPMKESLQ